MEFLHKLFRILHRRFVCFLPPTCMYIYYRKELTSCWIWFFNLCFPLLWFTKSILSLCNGLPWGTLPLYLNIKPKCLCSGTCPVHLWRTGRKKWKIPSEACHSRRYLQDYWPFYCYFLTPTPTSCSVTSDCDPIDCSPPGFSVPEIFQAGILEWVAISYSRGSSGSRESLAYPALTGRFFTTVSPGKSHLSASLCYKTNWCPDPLKMVILRH